MFGQGLNFGGLAVPAVPQPLSVDYLLVAGGGGASGNGFSGGGGAGGLRTSYPNTSTLNGHTESSLSLSTLVDYNVTIGAGGAGAVYDTTTVGSNSKFGIIGSEITSTGGGCGLYGYNVNATTNNGGSGGGASNGTYPATRFGSAVTTPVTQGYDGAGVGTTNPPVAVGGGGANGIGLGGSNAYLQSFAGAGGPGLTVNILNNSNATTANVGQVSSGNVYYAGGGGGAGRSTYSNETNYGGAGGIGGGATGGLTQRRSYTPWYANSQNGGSGRVNSGGGAGGGGFADAQSGGTRTGGNGGSGVLVVRYPSQFSINETTSNLLTFETFIEGNDKVTVFKEGEGTIQFS